MASWCMDSCIGAWSVAVAPAIEIRRDLCVGSVPVFGSVLVGFVCNVDPEIYSNQLTTDRDTLRGGDDGNKDRGYSEC